MPMTSDEIKEILRPVQDPEVNISIVSLGLIYGIDIDEAENSVAVQMTLTSPGCPIAGEFVAMVKTAVEEKTPYKNVTVDLVFDPPWDPKTMCDDEAKDRLGIW